MLTVEQPPECPAAARGGQQQQQLVVAEVPTTGSTAADPVLVGVCCVVQGGFQYYLYNHLFVKWCAGMTNALGHKGSAPIKTFIDQAIQ